ncbi:hypothetical protein BH09VER1_BH09VER1_03270 [soil metagenome]
MHRLLLFLILGFLAAGAVMHFFGGPEMGKWELILLGWALLAVVWREGWIGTGRS